MIEINLLPEERKARQKRLKQFDLSNIKIDVKNLPIVAIIGGVFAVLISIQIILFLIEAYSGAMRGFVDKKYKAIGAKASEARALKSQVDTINKKMAAIDELMVKRFSWAKKLSYLSDSMTPGIWLTNLSYDEKIIDKPASPETKPDKNKNRPGPSRSATEKVVSKYMVISGYAASMGEEGTALVGKFIQSLKDNPNFYSDFSEIELGAIKRDRIEDQEVMSFNITCYFKE